MPEQAQTPRVLWAQQHETVLLTIAVPDIDKVDVKFEEDSVEFHGQSSPGSSKENNVYAVKIDLYDKVDPQACKYDNVAQKYWRLLLKKKDSSGAFWPRLTKDKARFHWLLTDFDHWKEEDESDDEKQGNNGNFQDMFPGGMGGMDDMADEEDDSDDEESDPDDENVSPASNETKKGDFHESASTATQLNAQGSNPTKPSA